MQDEVNEKTIALYIKTGKLTAQTLQKAMKAILSKGKKQLAKPPQGKQSLKQLMKQNAGVSNIEITEGNIKAFESTAKKYGIDFALKKDATESPPRYLVFFKGRDADVLTAAFKEFSAKKLTQEKNQKLGKQLMTEDEIAVMDGGKCILQLRGVRPFFSDKFDITKHPKYKYLSDADPKNAFDMEKHLKRRPAIVKPDEVFDYYEIDAADLQEDADHEET